MNIGIKIWKDQILWNDKTINISWPINKDFCKPILNHKDTNALTLFDAEKSGDIF